jgi:hypothetical protein
VETAEKFADSLVPDRERNETYVAARAAANDVRISAQNEYDRRRASLLYCAVHSVGTDAQVDRIHAALDFAGLTRARFSDGQRDQLLHLLLRDIVGNPFRLVTVDTAWLENNDKCVVRLAQAIYAGRAFDRLPILADALEDAGCTDAAILEHCRGPGPHVRGCWVVDLLLGKQ